MGINSCLLDLCDFIEMQDLKESHIKIYSSVTQKRRMRSELNETCIQFADPNTSSRKYAIKITFSDGLWLN